MKTGDLADRFTQVLLEARQQLSIMDGGGTVMRRGASFGDSANDTELAADRDLGRYLVRALLGTPSVAQDIASITVEGLGEFPGGVGDIRVYIDPVDGSLNYKTRGTAIGLPYSGCITAVERDSRFADVVAAAVCDYRSGDSWQAHWNGGSFYVTTLNGKPARTLSDTKLDLGSQIVIGEMYYPQNRERLCRAFAGKKGWLRSPGSAAYEMALVASGTAAAFICDQQKQHELGAGYALVLGAGGVAVDFDGDDLGPRIYDFKTQTPAILAANRPIADAILALLHHS